MTSITKSELGFKMTQQERSAWERKVQRLFTLEERVIVFNTLELPVPQKLLEEYLDHKNKIGQMCIHPTAFIKDTNGTKLCELCGSEIITL